VAPAVGLKDKADETYKLPMLEEGVHPEKHRTRKADNLNEGYCAPKTVGMGSI